ncbi:MAG: chemotaxis protein CheB [Pseudomonadales bacterium]|nr:chemotaxis protein CheB [Pseudomonadales bacterium]
MTNRHIKAIVAGVSQGGIVALETLLPQLSKTFDKPIIIVQHRAASSDTFLSEHLNSLSLIQVEEAEEKQPIKSGTVYLAPAGYHLLIEQDMTFSLSCDERVNFTRPSVDVLFESAADCYTHQLLGIILTGYNSDGAKGLQRIKQAGGLALVQDPEDAEVPDMPLAAIKITPVDAILTLDQLAQYLNRLS